MTLLVLALMAQLQSDAPPAPLKVSVRVGEQKASPIPTALGVICDDRTIVEVLDLGDHLAFKGLAVGKTLCGLGRGKLPPQVIEITIEKTPVDAGIVDGGLRDGGPADGGLADGGGVEKK